MLRERLINLLTEAANRAQKQGKLPSVVLPEITSSALRIRTTAIMLLIFL